MSLFAELPDEFLVLNDFFASKWIYLETNRESLGKVYQDYNKYFLYDTQDNIIAQAKYGFKFCNFPYFHFKGAEGNLIGSLETPSLIMGHRPCFEIYSPNKELLFYVQSPILSYYVLRPFVLLDPEDKHPILLISHPWYGYWNVLILDKAKVSTIDQTLLLFVVALLADLAHWF